MDITKVAVAVGWYDLIVGIWPLIGPKSFNRTAGTDEFLGEAKMIGTMWASLGAALLLSSSNRSIIPFLGLASTIAGSTLALTQCGLVTFKRLPKVFLLQSLAETVIGLTWIISLTNNVIAGKDIEDQPE